MLTAEERKILEDIHAWALPRTRQSQMIESRGWRQVVSEDYKSPAFNEVLESSVWENQLEQKVLETIELYRKVGTAFKWGVTPRTRPANTGEVLLKHGFTHWPSAAMYLRPAECTFSQNTDVVVRGVGADQMKDFVDLFMRCWNIKPEEHAPMRDQLYFDHEQSAIYERFVAYVKGAPAGVASMVRNDDCGYLHATAVLPEFQGAGAYRALVEARVKVLQDLEIPLAYTEARELTSAPRLERMGFQRAWSIDMYLKALN